MLSTLAMSNVEICQVAYEGRMTRLKMMLESNPKLISVADQVGNRIKYIYIPFSSIKYAFISRINIFVYISWKTCAFIYSIMKCAYNVILCMYIFWDKGLVGSVTDYPITVYCRAVNIEKFIFENGVHLLARKCRAYRSTYKAGHIPHCRLISCIYKHRVRSAVLQAVNYQNKCGYVYIYCRRSVHVILARSSSFCVLYSTSAF